jgi:hypothetical protein
MNVAPKAIAEGSKVNASPCCDIELPIWEIVKSSVANPISSRAAQLMSSIEIDRMLPFLSLNFPVLEFGFRFELLDEKGPDQLLRATASQE